jgi:DNA-binding NarL/FixJ family response regulator
MSIRVPIWIDHSDPLLRRGLATCLRRASYPIVGESNSLHPRPDVSTTRLLLFEASPPRLARALAVGDGTDLLLVGLLDDGAIGHVEELRRAGLAGVLNMRTLTVARLLQCVEAVVDGPRRPSYGDGHRIGASASQSAGLTARESLVIQLLADGASTREIAGCLNYSERTVKNIVREVLSKLRSRSRAHAVAVAARQGVI